MSMVPPTPRKPPVVTQDSRSPLRRGLDALASTWRQSGIGNYLPSPNEVGRGVASFLFPTATAAGRNVKPTDFLGDAALAFAPVGLGNTGRLSAIVRRLNKSENVEDFITPETMRYAARPNDANEGLYRPGAQSFDYSDVPEPATPYTFGLVPTEKLLPLREFDRAAEPAGQKVFGPDNVNKLAEHLASGGKLSDPLAVSWDPNFGWGYLAEGNHRLAAAQALGLEQLPATVWRTPSALKYLTDKYTPNPAGTGPRFDYGKTLPPVGRRMEIDTNQLRRDQFGDFPKSVGDYYVPPTMHPFLFRYFQP